jgi:hypothetical protein
LQQALRLLSGNVGESLSTIYLVTDLQKSACRNLTACPVPQDIEIKVLPVGDLASPNVAILQLDAQQQEGSGPQVSLASFG